MPIVTIHPTGEEIYLEPGKTVLEGLFQAGYAFTVGCKRGGCAICKVDCRTGEFSYNRPIADSVLSEEERIDGTCLTCRAVPDTDLTIEMRDLSLRLINPFLRQLNSSARQRAEAQLAETVQRLDAADTISKES